MATNKFATKLSRNTNRITVILVYAFLEWLLMFFLFLNSLFTYFLVKFASFFGLKQVCVLCPNINRIFEKNPEARFSYKDLICENHFAELASLSFCKTHRKQLSESVNLCSDCSSGHEERSNLGLGFCDCCQKSLGDKPFLNYLLFKSSIWGNSLGNRENEGFLLEMIDDDKIGDGFDEREIESDQLGFFNEADKGKKQELQLLQNGEVISDVESYGLSLREVSEEDGLRSNVLGKDDDDSVKFIDRFEHEFDSCETERLIPVKLIDSSTIINLEETRVVSEDEQSDDDHHRHHDHHQHHDHDDERSNADTFVEDKTSEIEEEQEQEQFGANKLTCKLKNEAFIVENLSNGFDPLLADSENDEEENIERKLEENFPKTPILAKKLVIHTKNEYEIVEDDDPVKTIERLKEIVKAEEEALRGLYAELEEERSASAIATNQTMAMITRLQEEKAKVQMEALQYQRMMEEQAEYDQEALQLLNHLMVKREKEKEELKKELEVYKEKVLEYESKAKKLDQDEEKDNNGDQENREDAESCENDVDLEKVTMDCVKHMSLLDESLSEFEEERLVILDQLKVLEDKLLTMQENESAEDSKFHGEFSNSYEENEGNADSHGFSEGITMASMAKSLLPLLDAAENESEDGFQGLPESINLSSESEKLEIIKQVDNVYERLQVLQTDGDKGTDLLQDILQHLRDLRTIELSETVENQTNHDE